MGLTVNNQMHAYYTFSCGLADKANVFDPGSNHSSAACAAGVPGTARPGVA